MKKQHPVGVTFVIMAGGKGERLWPLVHADHPKVCLSPDGKRSLLETTIERVRFVWPDAKYLIVTTEQQLEPVKACLRRLNHGDHKFEYRLLVEPQTKNTASCITLAAMTLGLRNHPQIMVAVPADHWIDNKTAFREALRKAIRVATTHDTLVTIGIRPTYPHPGLGYLCTGKPLTPGIFTLEQFIEKPTLALASRLLKRPQVYWNSGIFVGMADKFLECVTEWLPEHAHRLFPLLQETSRSSFLKRARKAYQALRAISFDQGVMDHWKGGFVVEGRFRWADLGSLDSWARFSSSSTLHTIHLKSRNVTALSTHRHLLATIGVRDLIVACSPSATLVCSSKHIHAVRQLVRQISRHPRLSDYQ